MEAAKEKSLFFTSVGEKKSESVSHSVVSDSL